MAWEKTRPRGDQGQGAADPKLVLAKGPLTQYSFLWQKLLQDGEIDVASAEDEGHFGVGGQPLDPLIQESSKGDNPRGLCQELCPFKE